MPTAPRSTLPAALAELNAQARRAEVTEAVAGITIHDPYRALEADSPATQRWIAAQTERTEHALARYRDPAAEERLRALLTIGSMGHVAVGGERVFFTLREGARERAALYALDASTPSTPSAARAARALPNKPLIDPASFGERASLDYAYPSPDGRLVAFGISEDGDERATLRVHDVRGGAALADTIPHAKWSSVSWLPDGSGFYYTRYPRPGEPDYDADHEDTYHLRVFFHALGQDPASDALVFAGKEPTDFPSATVDETGRYVVLLSFRSWTASDLWLWDRGEKASARQVTPGASDLLAVVVGEDALTTGSVRNGQLYLLTNLEAPKKRIVRVAPAHAGERGRWHTLVPETAASLEEATFSTRWVVTHAIEDMQSKLALRDPDGKLIGEVALPTRGSIDALDISPTGTRIAFLWSSFFHPPTLYSYDASTRTLTALYQVQHDLDTAALVLERAHVRSADGTLVHVHFMHRRDLPHDGHAKVLIEGYGGFDVSLLPELRRSALHFVERGGIYAVANLRGGGELGEAWHRAGMLENKHRVFEDFEAVIRFFTESGASNPKRIAITGGSNGGLLMGAMLTRVPETFAAAVSYVGLYDMLRYPLFPPAALWTSEYGDPADPALARYLHGYSPYHRVQDGTAYPAALIETADHDTRVHWAHSTKFAARLQDATHSARPVYFYMEKSVGHGAGTGLTDLVRREARKHAFLTEVLGP